MNYFLYQLQFKGPVHFGRSSSALSLGSAEGHFRADTLFSALCHTALQLYGQNGLERLIAMTQGGALRLSDSMPWKDEVFFLPKPYYTAQTSGELPAEKRKAIKKLAWIPVADFADYCSAIKTGAFFDAESVSFGIVSERTMAEVPENDDTRPYSVGQYTFREGCGLYFLLGCERKEDNCWLSELVTGLGLSGIGGKVSAGYGKFAVRAEYCLADREDPQSLWLQTALTEPSASVMVLTTSLPAEEELDDVLENAFWQVVRRGGFIASDSGMTGKKQTQYFLDAGSVVKHRYSGTLYDVGSSGDHPVYRFSCPIFLGVTL